MATSAKTTPGMPADAPAARRPSWKLAAPHDTLTQGLVVSGFGDLPCALALFLEFGWDPPAAGETGRGAWLRALQAIAPVTDADGKDPRAAALALTYTGLERMGLPRDALASFSPAFQEGMFQQDRLRRLGDTDAKGAWTPSVIDGGPKWSGNTPLARIGDDADDLRAGGVFGPEPDDRPYPTPVTVHALLLLYDARDEDLESWAGEVRALLGEHGVRVSHERSLSLRLDQNGVAREHFGFADGISQPVPYSAEAETGGEAAVVVQGRPAVRDRWHGVPLGEILFGHVNGHHEQAPGPLVRDTDERAQSAGIPADGAPRGYLNLGLDGSYMVVRELKQDVAAFWKSVNEGAERIAGHSPDAACAKPEGLAARIVGRDLDGHLLCPSGVLAADEYNYPQNAFGFLARDPHGIGCPAGSHVRRANPRDGLAKDEASAQTLLDAANNHRILRRARKYGETVKDPLVPDGEDRGLLFMCLSTDIARQFEFVQQTWLLNQNFATLYDESDPLVGPKGGFTIREQPLRRIVPVETFVRMAGGEYFFLPSLPAVRYLASL